MMRIYVAGPWSNRDEVIEAAAFLRADGFQVRARWLDENCGDVATFEGCQQRALMDVDDVKSADVFVLLNLGMSSGKATELGMAHIIGLPIVVVGPPATPFGPQGNMFYYLPGVTIVETLADAVSLLRKIERMEV